MNRGLEYKKGMGESVLVAQARRIKELEAENANLKINYINLMAEWEPKFRQLGVEFIEIAKQFNKALNQQEQSDE